MRTWNWSLPLALLGGTVGCMAPAPAPVDSSAIEAEVLADLQKTAFVELKEQYPQLTVSLVGQQREQQEAFASLGQNYVMALFVIFALLATHQTDGRAGHYPAPGDAA